MVLKTHIPITVLQAATVALVCGFLLSSCLRAASWGDRCEHCGIIYDRCESVELNHFYDKQGNLQFKQFIWKDPNDVVVDWRFVNKCRRPLIIHGHVADSEIRPCKQMVFFDGHNLRVMRFTYLSKSWTQHDPEVCARKVWPLEKRRQLPTPTVNGQ